MTEMEQKCYLNFPTHTVACPVAIKNYETEHER